MIFFDGSRFFNTKGYHKIWMEPCEDGIGIFGKDGSDSKDLIFSFPDYPEAVQVMNIIANHYSDDDETYWVER